MNKVFKKTFSAFFIFLLSLSSSYSFGSAQEQKHARQPTSLHLFNRLQHQQNEAYKKQKAQQKRHAKLKIDATHQPDISTQDIHLQDQIEKLTTLSKDTSIKEKGISLSTIRLAVKKMDQKKKEHKKRKAQHRDTIKKIDASEKKLNSYLDTLPGDATLAGLERDLALLQAKFDSKDA